MKSRKRLIKELDKIFSIRIKQRDGWACQKCGKVVEGSNCQCAHIIPRSAGSKLRWDMINAMVLCMHCHFSWWHKNILEAQKWFKDTFPKRYKYLMEEKGLKQWKTHELEELLQGFKDLDC